MKTTLLCLTLLFATYVSYSQTNSNYYADYPVIDVKESFNDDFVLFYNVKLANKTKKDITSVLFVLEPTWLDGETQLMRALRAEKTITSKRTILIRSGQTVLYKMDTPSNKYAVSVQLVRYSDGSIKKY